MVRQAVMPRVHELTQDQWGLVTRQQLSDAGIGNTTIERLASSGGPLERVARGVYRLAGAPVPDHLELRAAWLQLAPGVPAWQRGAAAGAVSHRSAASLYDLGDLPADRHEFTAATRRQSRRQDVRIHILHVSDGETAVVRGLPTTRPPRIAADLLRDHEDPEAVARITAEAIREGIAPANAFAETLAPHATSFGFRRHDGQAVLRWLLELSGENTAAPGVILLSITHEMIQRRRAAWGRIHDSKGQVLLANCFQACAHGPNQASGKGQPMDDAAAPTPSGL